MTSVRYVGTSVWSRVRLDDDGSYAGMEPVAPGEVVEDLSDDAVKAFLSGPRALRVFVEANGPEDRYGEKYEPNRFEAARGNASPYPELEMGSTVTGGRPIFRTEEDNEEGFDVAGSDEGPRSDNTDVRLRMEVQEEADKAAQRKREEQEKARAQAKQKSTTQTRRDQKSEG